MQPILRDIEAAARILRIELRSFNVRAPEELEQAFDTMKTWEARGVVLVPDPMLNANGIRISALATARRIPSAGQIGDAKGAFLVNYGVDSEAMFRRAAYPIDRILKGAKPRDLSIEQPTTFRMVLNQKIARALGIKFPQSLLVRVDEVIE